MLTIIATIKPEHLGNIRSGKKLLEMRKICPKDVPFRVLCLQEEISAAACLDAGSH